MDHNYEFFEAQLHSLYTRYTWFHTQPHGLCMQVRYRFSGSPPRMGLVQPTVRTHWVVSRDNQFLSFLTDPKVQGLTRHETALSRIITHRVSTFTKQSTSLY